MKLENTLSIPVPAEEAWRVLLDVERIAPCMPGATLISRDGDSYQGKIKVKLGPIGLTYSGTVRFLSQDETAKVAVLEASGRETRGGGTAKALVTCRLVDAGESTDVLVETDLDITGKPAQFGRGALAEVAGTIVGKFAENLAAELSSSSSSAAAAASNGSPSSNGAGAASAAAPATGTAAAAGSAGSNGSGPSAAAAEPAAPAPVPAQKTGDGDTPAAASPTPASPAAAPPASGSSAAARTAPRPAAEPIDLLNAAGIGGLQRYAPAVIGALLLLLVLLLRRSRPITVNVVFPDGTPSRK